MIRAQDAYLAVTSESQVRREAIIAELIEALQDFAPRYATFGAHPDDGADFGFWLDLADLGAVREHIKENGGLVLNDLSQLPLSYRGEVLHINDHGNVTLYDAKRTGLVAVWAVV